MSKRIITLILIIIWMIVVFCFSNQTAEQSTKLSEGIAQKTSKSLKIENNKQKNTETIIRKIAHFALYALGGILMYEHFKTYNIKGKNKIIFSQITGSLYAVTDEIHQIFIPGRSGEVLDVFIDSLGIIAGILLIIIINKKITLEKERRK